ncbi:hypothetical protein R5R35_011159 [Gryllus longicercus]|uniref:Phospholipid/glycerol acyltransferase domain-containing protein n=1 Tax=Gryllus longicercus TaxID=2509291 RepID=A0AAN9Z0U6_9ORTH
MLDVMSTQLQGPSTPSTGPNAASLGSAPRSNSMGKLSLPSLRRVGYHERVRTRQLIRDNMKKTMNSKSFPVKQMEWNIFWGKTGRPFQGLCCAACTPNSQISFVTEASKTTSLKNVLDVDAQNGKGFLTRRLCHLNTVWNLKKYDYPQLSPTVLRDERLQQAVVEAAKRDAADVKEDKESLYDCFLKKHEERATRVVMKMRSTLSDFLLRLTSWILYKLLPCFLTSVAAHPGQLRMLHAAGETGLPLIFLPLHRSHLDYILISFILLNNNIRSPLVAAGDNLSIPVFGWLLRGLGAFFIKRRMDPVAGQKDVVYRAALHTYMIHCLRAGHNMEFYIEGGRTRTGKPSLPKGGLLSVIVDAYMDGTIEDALLVPVSVNYEKLVDGNFVRELLGQPKKMETFGSAVKGIWSVLNSNYGMMRIDFNQPFSLRELVQSFQANTKIIMRNPRVLMSNDDMYSDTNKNSMTISSGAQMHHVPSSASLFGTDYVDDKSRFLVESIARHILYDATRSTSIMSTNAIAFLLLNKHRCGTTLGNLVRSLDELRKELLVSERDVGFCGESIDVVNHAVELLGPGLVRKEKKILPIEGEDPEPTIFISPVIMLPNVIELSYYSNTVLAFYVMDSITATGLVSLLPFDMYHSEAGQQSSAHAIWLESLMEAAYELCDILQFEFIFTKPCQHLETVLMDRIDSLCTANVLLLDEAKVESDDERGIRPSRRIPSYLEYDSEEDDLANAEPQTKYTLNIERDALRRLDFLHGLLRPLVDTYAASASVLERLASRSRSEKELVHDILAEVKVQLDSGQCQYGESLSVDPIKNSLKLFERWGVLECHIEENVKLYYLSESRDSEESVREVYNKINKYKWIIGNQ